MKHSNPLIINYLQYKCRDEPILQYKSSSANVYLICCLNAIDQTINNIKLLHDEIKKMIHSTFINSEIFDATKITLNDTNKEHNDEDKSYSYIKNNELSLIESSIEEIPDIIKEYEALLQRKIRISFEYLFPNVLYHVYYLVESFS